MDAHNAQHQVHDTSLHQIEPGAVRSNTSLTVQTVYIGMLLELQEIHWSYNFLAGIAGWSLLAGFLVIPGTFTTLQKSSAFEESLRQSNAEKLILDTIQNPPLVAMAWLFLGTGAGLMLFLFLRWRHNYIWLINRLFIPTSLNTLAGLLTAVINVFTAKDGYWSIMALLTVITSGLLAAMSLALVIIYQFWKLRLVKDDHYRESKAGMRLMNPEVRERSSSPYPLGSSSFTKRED
ncbi:hypothetical protein BDV39DRAFT_202109 [Aspergillus sergii]|uniref:Uncharacterized protein n=1 Tax=Aspergillus sergii TaxID=1034303 RepID=A0A5N6XAN2_9EURO|nr:hypothetical protein BDV39DRAFT_202109 [Aspergillus sergii]